MSKNTDNEIGMPIKYERHDENRKSAYISPVAVNEYVRPEIKGNEVATPVKGDIDSVPTSAEITWSNNDIDVIDFGKIAGVRKETPSIPVEVDFAKLVDSLIDSPKNVDVETLKNLAPTPTKAEEKPLLGKDSFIPSTPTALQGEGTADDYHIPTLKERMEKDLADLEKASRKKKFYRWAALLLVIVGVAIYAINKQYVSIRKPDQVTNSKINSTPEVKKEIPPENKKTKKHSISVANNTSSDYISGWLFDRGWGISKADILKKLNEELKTKELVTGEHAFESNASLADIMSEILKNKPVVISEPHVKEVVKQPEKPKNKIVDQTKVSPKKKVASIKDKKEVSEKKSDLERLRLDREEKLSKEQLKESYSKLMDDVDKTLSLLDDLETKINK